MEEEKELTGASNIEASPETTTNEPIVSEPVLEQTVLPLEPVLSTEAPLEAQTEAESEAETAELVEEKLMEAEEPVESPIVEAEQPAIEEAIATEATETAEPEVVEPKATEELKAAEPKTIVINKVNRIIAIVVVLLIVLVAIFMLTKKSVSNEDSFSDVKVSVDGQVEQGKVSIIEETRSDIKVAVDNNDKVIWPKTKAVAYFGNTQKNPNSADCSLTYPLEREIEKKYDSNMLNSVLALLEPLKNSEKEAGYVSVIPDGSYLKHIKLDDSGVATASFSGNLDKAAGSCAVMAIKAQIKDTLLQFASVKSVVICIDDNCQEDEILQP